MLLNGCDLRLFAHDTEVKCKSSVSYKGVKEQTLYYNDIKKMLLDKQYKYKVVPNEEMYVDISQVLEEYHSTMLEIGDDFTLDIEIENKTTMQVYLIKIDLTFDEVKELIRIMKLQKLSNKN